MSDRLSRAYVGAAFVVALCFGVSHPALAGFQWVEPSDTASSSPLILPPIPAANPSPSATSGPEIISPVVITGVAAPAAPAAPAMPVTVTAASPQPTDNSVVVGFAKSVPLAVALRQILPSGYAFSVDQDVDMGTLVSFQGGRSWRDTLRDTLAPTGLVMREHGQMVEVGFAHELTAPAPLPTTDAHASQSAAPTFQAGTEPKILSVPSGTVALPPSPLQVVPSANAVFSPSSPSSQVSESWTADRGETLRKVLEDWCHRANVEFDWFSEYDYPLEASISISGNFETAVRSLLTGFQNAHPQPVAELHSNTNLGQMVLAVQTRGNTNSD